MTKYFCSKRQQFGAEKLDQLKDLYKKHKEEKQFQISKPIDPKQYFLTNEEKDKQTKIIKKSLNDYLASYKFDSEFDIEKFIKLLSDISYTVDNQFVLENNHFQQLLTERAENLLDFAKSYRSVLLFFSFCSVQNINIQQDIWECFNSFFLNHHKQFTIQDKIMLLQNQNSKNSKEIQMFFELFENSFLEEIRKDKFDFYFIYQILQVYRFNQQGTQNFFFTIEEAIEQQISDISIPNLISLLTHYATNQSEPLKSRIKMLEIFEKQLTVLMKFLNPNELVAIFYCYIKVGRGSDLFFTYIEDRVLLTIDQFSIIDMKKLLIIAQNRQNSVKQIYAVAETFIRQNFSKFPSQFFPEIFFLYCETGQGSKEFFELVENTLIKIIYQMETEILTKCLWGFFIINMGAEQRGILFYEKVQERIMKTNLLEQMTIKEISTTVWCMSKLFTGKPEFFKKIEQEVIQKRTLSCKDSAHLLWGYIQNQPITLLSLNKIKEAIIKDKENLDVWDMQIIAWGISKFENAHIEHQDIFIQIRNEAIELVEEMSNYEFICVLRGYVETWTENKELVNAIANRLDQNIQTLNYEEVTISLYCLTSMNNVEIDKELFTIIEKLEKRMEELQSLANISEESEDQQNSFLKKEKMFESNFSDPEQFLKNQEFEKLK